MEKKEEEEEEMVSLLSVPFLLFFFFLKFCSAKAENGSFQRINCSVSSGMALREKAGREIRGSTHPS